MPRFAPVEPAQATGRVKEIFDGPLKGKHINIFKSMAQSPALLETYLALSGVLGKASLSPKEVEAIQLAIAQANSCDYCVAAHTVVGKGAGLTEAQTVEARKGHVGDPKLNALVKFALAIHEKKGHLSDGDLSAFKSAGYNEQQAGEVLVAYTLISFTNNFNHMNQTVVDFPTPPAI